MVTIEGQWLILRCPVRGIPDTDGRHPRPGSRKWWRLLGFLTLLLTSDCRFQERNNATPVPFEILRDSSGRLSQGTIIRLQGRITFLHPARGILVMQEGILATRINLPPRISQFKVGQLIEAQGIVGPNTAGELPASQVDLLDSRIQLPLPIPLSLKSLAADPRQDYRLVEIKGLARAITRRPNAHSYLEVVTPEGVIEVVGVNSFNSEAYRLIGQQIQLSGVARAVRGIEGQVLRFEVWMADWRSIIRPPMAGTAMTSSGCLEGLPWIKTVKEIRALSLKQASLCYPVRLRAVITSRSMNGDSLFVQDPTGSIYVRHVIDSHSFATGDLVEIEGKTVEGSFNADVILSTIRQLGRVELPKPLVLSFQELWSGGHDTEWVQLQGVVRSFERDIPASGANSPWRLNIADGAYRMEALVEDVEAVQVESWLNARVQFQGVCDTVVDERHQLSTVRVLIPSVQHVQILQRGSIESSDLPRTVIGDLLRFSPTGELQQRVRIEGSVSATPLPMQGSFYLQDHSGGVLVRTAPAATVTPGDHLEVVGYSYPSSSVPLLLDARIRKLDPAPMPVPVRMTAEDAMFGDFDAQLVHLEGVLLQQTTLYATHEMTLMAGPIVFIAALESRQVNDFILHLRPGALLELTGVCSTEHDQNRRPRAFRVLLRSTRDISVIHNGPWWTIERTISVLAAMGLLIAVIMTWAARLQSKVRRQSAVITGQEEEGRRIEETLHAVFSSSPDAMFILNADGSCGEANLAACELLQRGKEEIRSLSPADFLACLGLSEVPEDIHGSGRLSLADGTFRHFDYSVRRSFWADRHLLIVRDMSEQRRMEEKLRQAQKMESIGRLAGGIAHDFNNLLTVISGYCEILLYRLKEPPLRENALQIKKAGERAAELTSQLLAFSRRQVIQPRVLDLNAIITDTTKMIRRVIGEDIELQTSLAAELGSILADPGQISQILMNLAGNARDAMPGIGRLLIETQNIELEASYAAIHPEVKPGRYVLLVVSDSGQGMTPETRTHLFEPFFTTKPLGQGTGLGLSTVYGIVKQAGGHISVYSELGKGTTFKVYLPRVDACPLPELNEERPVYLPGGPETILLVEDQQEVRQLAAQILQTAGYQIIESHHPSDALQLVQTQNEPIHLLITDIVMPGMNGKELADQVIALRPEIKVLYISGYTENIIVLQGVLKPNVNYLSKPFSPAQLTARVAEVLQKA